MEAVILERIRELHHITRRSDIFKSSQTEENKVLLKLKETQLKIRCGEKYELRECIEPFLLLFNLSTVSSPYITCALEALQHFLRCGLFEKSSWKEELPGLTAQIIQSITGCKFVSTDVSLDSRCHLESVQVLHLVLMKVPNIEHFPCFQVVVEYCLTLVDGSRPLENLMSMPVVLAAQHVLHEAAQKVSRYIRTGPNDMQGSLYECWLKWLRYCLRVLLSRRTRSWYDLCEMGAVNVKFNHEQPTAYERSNVVLCLTMLKYLVVEVTTSNNFASLVHRSDVFQLLLIELGYSIIDVALSDISVDEFRVLNHLVIATITSGASQWFPFIRNFCTQIIMRKLQFFFYMLQKQVGSDHPFSAYFAGHQQDVPEQSLEFLEIVLESLTDLAADASFLTLLYTEFDCDFSHQEILLPMVGLISQCASLVLTTGTERLGELKDMGIAVVQCFKQIIHTLSMRISVGADSRTRRELNAVLPGLKPNRSLHRDAAEMFIEKPSTCFIFLQSQKLLPNPITAESVASYLRHASWLPKDKVGSYLGELGKTDAKFSADSVDFHKAVLHEYVKSFQLYGMDISSCLRIFLSAFRLPGEAQQIDRILIAFSEHCHLHSKDSALGIVENAEVTYLLLFSIIMLNTDRHNPNIRPEKKMTLEQFIRNNSFYGKELNQTRSIPRDYLEQLYNSIDAFPIRTESRDFFGIFNIEEWLDELYGFRRQICLSAENGSDERHHRLAVQGNIDRALIDSIMPYLLLPCFSVHLYNMLLFYHTPPTLDGNGIWWKERVGRLLDLSCDFMNEILQLSGKLQTSYTVDAAVVLLYEVCFLQGYARCGEYLKYCFTPVQDVDTSSLWTECNTVPPITPRYPNEIFYERLARPSMQRALITLLGVISNFAGQISHWEIVVFILSQLRDFALLPLSIVDFADEDLLPFDVRRKFEELMCSSKQVTDEQVNVTNVENSSKRLSTLEYLGEALFGTPKPILDEEPENSFDLYFHAINDKDAKQQCGYDNELHELWLDSTRNLRTGIEKTMVATLISESKFLTDESLVAFLTAIVKAVEKKLNCGASLQATDPSQRGDNPFVRGVLNMINSCNASLDFLIIMSFSSAVWLESVLAEIVLRNRDRFHLCWPILQGHYYLTLAHPNVELSRISEVQLIGFLKLSSRLVSRDNCSTILIEFLGRLCSVQQFPATRLESGRKGAKLGLTLTKLIDQLMSGMWKLLTLNVELLPRLSLEQWEIIFSIVAAGAESNSFAAYKAFEIMSWLLHEPRLVANIPIFSVVAIRPLVSNTAALPFVSVGAIHLLLYMQSRLEPVLNQIINDVEGIPSDDDDDDVTGTSADSPSLVWKTCWLPILQAIYVGHNDLRPVVRFTSLAALSKILTSSYVRSMPQKILIEAVVHKFIPASFKLLSFMEDLKTGTNNTHSSTEAKAQEFAVPLLARSISGEVDATSVIKQILTTLEDLVSANVSSLSTHPAFDKLWLEALNLMISTINVSRSCGDPEVANLATTGIKRMFVKLQSEGVFEQKAGLRLVSLDYVSNVDSEELSKAIGEIVTFN